MYLSCYHCKQGFDIKFFNPLRINASCPHCATFNHLGEAIERVYGRRAGDLVKKTLKALENVGARGKENLSQLADLSWWRIEQVVAKFGVLAVLTLALAIPAPAKPWYKDWKSWAVIGVSVGSSLAASHNAHECRERFGPAPCAGGYGPFAARETARFAISAGLAAHAIWGRHQGVKPWPVFALGVAAYNTSVAVGQTQVGCPAGQEFAYFTSRCQKVD